jgi:type IV pilus assembly protein PilB
MTPSDFMERVFTHARAIGATDIHIEPNGNGIQLRFRANGVLSSNSQLTAGIQSNEIKNISAHLKAVADVPAFKVGYIVDARYVPHNAHEMVCRLSFVPLIGGAEKIAIRVLHSYDNLTLENLRLNRDNLTTITSFFDRTGLVLVTGPAGSGKSTLLYSILEQMVRKHKDALSINTVEDPVERKILGVAQTELNHTNNVTWATALRAIMRQDPRVIMIGEIRDKETAEIAIEAGLTGHLVLSTIHARSTFSVFPRLLEMKIEPYLAVSAVIGVISVRLLQLTCSECRAWRKRDFSPATYPSDQQIQLCLDQMGERAPDKVCSRDIVNLRETCESCHNGQGGGAVSLLTEVLKTESIQDKVMARSTDDQIEGSARDKNMRTLSQDAVSRLRDGSAFVENVAAVMMELAAPKA